MEKGGGRGGVVGADQREKERERERDGQTDRQSRADAAAVNGRGLGYTMIFSITL